MVKAKKAGVPTPFMKPTFSKKKTNLKKMVKVSKGALAAVEVHNKFVDAEEKRMKKSSSKKTDRSGTATEQERIPYVMSDKSRRS